MADGRSEGGAVPPRFVRALRWVLYGLLLASAAGTLLVLPALQRGGARPAWPWIALSWALLATFVVGYGAYRFALVRAGRYSAGKAFVQLGLMLAILGVVLGLSVDWWRAGSAGRAAVPVELARPLASSDPDVRALAAEVARHRPRADALAHAARLVELLGDPSPEVRRQAHASLVAILGGDAGEGPDAAPRWRERLRAAGALP